MSGRRLPLDWIPQSKPEAFPLNYDLISLVQNHAVSVAGNAASQKMDMHVARNPVRFEFEMMLLDLFQPERRMLLAGADLLAPYRRATPLHRYSARDVLELGLERQLRTDGTILEFGPGEQPGILHR